MLTDEENEYLIAMASMEELSGRLGTAAYIWGGMTADIYKGRFLRRHSDIDYFVVDLHRFSPQIIEIFSRDHWQVERFLEDHFLSAHRNGVKLHMGHIEIEQVVVWKHNGNHETIEFPVRWLKPEPVSFYNQSVHVIRPELAYMLKTNPGLMNPAWQPREVDAADIIILEEIL